MPHFWKNNTDDEILVVTYDELVPEFYSSVNSIKNVVSRAQRRGYGLRKVKNGGGRGELATALIEYDSLPNNIKEQIADPRKGLHILEYYWETDRDAVHFFQTHRLDDGRTIRDKIQDKYIANASLLNSVIRLRDARIDEIKSKAGVVKYLWQTLCSDVISFSPVCKSKFAFEFDVPENYRRLKEKVEKYEKLKSQATAAYKYLINEHHNKKNAQRVSDDMFGLFESIFAAQDHKPDFMEVYETYIDFLDGRCELINATTGELYNPGDFNEVGYATIRSWLSKWESKIATYAKRSGNRQDLMRQFKPAHKMDIDIPAGSLISIDDRQPPFKYDKNSRPWFYMGMDVGSDCWTTWVWGESKEGIILDFYRQMARNYYEWGFNLPLELECESSLNSSYRNTLLREGNMFDYVRIEANNARGKIVERRFGSLRYGDEKKIQGWIARPGAKKESNQAGPENYPLLPYGQIISNCLKEIEDWNNSPHPIHNDKTRWEVFCETQSPKTRPINWRGIIPYLGYKTDTYCNAGIVRLQGETWLLADKGEYVFGDELINLMRQAEGERLSVYWLDDNNRKVIKAFAYIGDTYICELLPQPVYKRSRADQTEDDMAKRLIMSKYVATIETYSKRKHEIERVEVINHTTPMLNNKFQIRELQESKSQHLNPAQYMSVKNTEWNDDYTVEVLPDADELECELIGVETPVKQSLYSRF